jgi:hypothetical protein
VSATIFAAIYIVMLPALLFLPKTTGHALPE